MAGGRPSTYSESLINEICERRAMGESMKAICGDDHMPSRSTVHKWLAEQPEFSDRYARACEIDADIEFDALQDIADEATPQDVQVAKLRIDTRKWVLSKRNPKKWGDRQEIEHTGDVSLSVRIVRPDAG